MTELTAPFTSPLARESLREYPQPPTLTGKLLHLQHEGAQEWIPIPADAGWAEPLRQRLQDTSQLLPNWDGYGANRPMRGPMRALVDLLIANGFTGRAPIISPLPDGGIHAEWNRGQRGVEIDISRNLEVEVVVVDGETMTDWRGRPGPDLRLGAALRDLT